MCFGDITQFCKSALDIPKCGNRSEQKSLNYKKLISSHNKSPKYKIKLSFNLMIFQDGHQAIRQHNQRSAYGLAHRQG